MAFQIVATILILVYAGGKLDAYVNNDTPWFTLLGAVLAVVGSMVYLIVRVTKSK
ncbi:MAG: AtpZ/AtpI family protein [Bacteroidetes bacterium]|nr:AtpZ/AtpI family protein [Bacteroidota bacterium]